MVEGLVDRGDEVVVLGDRLAGLFVELDQAIYVEVLTPKQRRRFDRGPGPVRIGDEFGGGGGEEDTAVGDALTQTLGGEHRECLAQGIARNAKALGQSYFIELLAGRKLAARDGAADFSSDVLSKHGIRV